ncbi:hypothetical protein L7F22_037503 [Adiantum nelumboides]|nr:hypothetical protein [Adiantum nelumboides]
MVAARINFQQGAKRNLKPMEAKEKQEYKGKIFSQNSSKGNSNNNKAKEKGVFKVKNKLTPEELERYRKENKCFKCGEQGHSYRSCPQRNPRNEQPRASMVEAPKEEVHCKGSPLSYAWGKVREHDAFILFDPGSTHNFISLELATKLGVQDFEMGDAMKADGAFINQEVSVTPLIGKLRLHIQGYVDKEDFFISPLKHEDVILGAPRFDRLAASIKFPERKISFKFREKDMYINAQESGGKPIAIPMETGLKLSLHDVEDYVYVTLYQLAIGRKKGGHSSCQVAEMVRISVLNDALKNMYNAEKRGKRQVLIKPSSKVIIKFLTVMQKFGYIGEFELVDDHRAGKIVVELNGRLNKCGVISPRYDVGVGELEAWTARLLPSRQFGHIVLTTSAGIMDHDEARRKNVGGKVLGFFY